MTEFGICRLCDCEKTLKESHIIPKFVFRWMKQKGGKYIRKADNPNKRVEDGVKSYLLCNECEQSFSKLEDKFARDIFYPYSNYNIDTFQYDKDLIKFSISVLYRLLLINLNPNQSFDNLHFNELLSALSEWKNFLQSGTRLKKFSKIHIYFTSDETIKDILPTDRFLNFFLRGVDGTIVSSNESCIVYAKMARIILIGEVKEFDISEMRNTLINLDGGEIYTKQMRLNPLFKEFFVDRVRQLNSFYDNVSEKQRNIAINFTADYKKNHPDSDVVKIIDKENQAIIDESLSDFE